MDYKRIFEKLYKYEQTQKDTKGYKMEHPILLKQVTLKGNSLIIKLDSPEKKLYGLKNKVFVQMQILGVIGSQGIVNDTEAPLPVEKKAKK